MKLYIYIHTVSYSSFDSELQHPEERTRLARWVNPRAWQRKSKRPSDSLCDSWISWLVDFEMTPRLWRQKDLWWFPYLAVMVFACCMLLSAKVPSFPLRSKRRWQNPLANQFRLHPGWNRTHMWCMAKVHGKGGSQTDCMEHEGLPCCQASICFFQNFSGMCQNLDTKLTKQDPVLAKWDTMRQC